MRAMLEPNNLRAMVQMQQAMQQLSGNFPGMPPMPGGAPASGAPAPSAGGLDFSSLLGGAPAPAPMANPWDQRQRYHAKIFSHGQLFCTYISTKKGIST